MPLVAFGGAGPLHATRLVRELGLGEAIVPPAPGLLSAAGLVGAHLRVDEALTVLAPLNTADPAELVLWDRDATARLRARLVEDGIPRGSQRVWASADCRYVGQGFELSVPVPRMTPAGVGGLIARFHR